MTEFAVERVEWTAEDRLEVAGRWFGLRGHRFLRPTLDVEVDGERRRMLALLEHKPWAAEEGEEWVAAFAWRGDPAGFDDAELTVSPDLAVQLPAPAPFAGERTAAAATPVSERRPAGRPRTAALEAELAEARATADDLRTRLSAEQTRVRALEAELERARGQVEAAEAAAAEAEAARKAAAETATEQADAARAAAVREAAAEQEAAAADVGALREERDAAVGARDAALAAAEGAREERDAVAERVAAMERERDALIEARDRARKERNAWMSRARAATAAKPSAAASAARPAPEPAPAPAPQPEGDPDQSRIGGANWITPEDRAEGEAPPGERRTVVIGERHGPAAQQVVPPAALTPHPRRLSTAWVPRLLAALALIVVVVAVVLLLT